LELAFGTGYMLRELGSRGFVPVGLDLSPWMVRHARRAVGEQVPLVRGRAQQLPFGDGSFDSVLCTFPAGFILAPETVNEVARVLRPGGRVVVVIMAQLLRSDLQGHLLEWLYRITGQRGEMPDLDTQLARAGLDGQIRQVRVGQSLVTLVVAEKTG
jgi:ubiquinone/menaquinone biosynthesis C-methylase UbiE